MGGGIGMGNTCKPMAVLFQCMTKFTTNKKKKIIKPKKKNKTLRVNFMESQFLVLKTIVDYLVKLLISLGNLQNCKV